MKAPQMSLIVNPYAPPDDDIIDCDVATGSTATIDNVSFPFQTISLSRLDELTGFNGPWKIKETTPFPYYDNSVSPPAVYTLLLVVIENEDKRTSAYLGEGL